MEKPVQYNRIVYFDVLRVLCIFFVIVTHVSSSNMSSVGVETSEWKIMNVFDSISRWAVPVLLMISGSLFLGRDIPIKQMYSKYIFRLVIAYFVWSLFYSAIDNLVLQMDFSAFAKDFIIGKYHLWFIPMIIGLYMITPFLRNIAKDNQSTRYFILLAMIFALAFPQITNVASVYSSSLGSSIGKITNKLHLKFVLDFPIYFVIGYYLNNVTLSRRTNTIIYILGIVGFLSTIIFTYIVSKRENTIVEVFYGNLTANVFLESIAIFTLFKNITNKMPFRNKQLLRLGAFSKYSFGAYLVHVFILFIINKFAGIHSLSFSSSISIPLISLSVFVFSFLASSLLNHIPIVKKYVV